MVREIVKLERKEKTLHTEKHEEILELINEIKSIEDKFKDLEIPQEDTFEKEVAKQELEQIDITGEIPNESQSPEIQTESEINEEIHLGKKKHNKRGVHFPIKIRWKGKPDGLKTKYFFGHTKAKLDVIEAPTDSQDHLKKPEHLLKPENCTFTLKINDQGRLVGFDIKKPEDEKKHRRILPFKIPFKKGASKEPGSKEPEESGIKGKITGKFKNLLSRIKPGQSTGESSSKISNILKKIKGILPNR